MGNREGRVQWTKDGLTLGKTGIFLGSIKKWGYIFPLQCLYFFYLVPVQSSVSCTSLKHAYVRTRTPALHQALDHTTDMHTHSIVRSCSYSLPFLVRHKQKKRSIPAVQSVSQSVSQLVPGACLLACLLACLSVWLTGWVGFAKVGRGEILTQKVND